MLYSFIRNLLLVTLCNILIALNCSAQFQKGYFFHNYDASNKLITKYNTFFFTDSHGFLWISSTEGLNRFDGLTTKTYVSNRFDSTTLFDNNIQSPFFEDSKENLWFCTYQAIHCYNRKTDNFTRCWLSENGKRIEKDYYVFHLDTEGYMWFRNGAWNTNPSVYRVNTHTISNNILQAERLGSFSGYRSKVVSHNEGNSTILTYPSTSGFGLDEYLISEKGKPIEQKEFFTGKPNDKYPIKFKIKTLLFDNDNSIWLATDMGLILFDKQNRKYEIFDAFKNEKIDAVLCLTAWGDNNLIISTKQKGILFFDKTKKRFYEQIKSDELKNDVVGLCSTTFEAIYVDKANNLWLASSGNSCLNHINLDKIKFSYIQSATQLNKDFSHLIEDDLHNIWVGYHDMGIVVYNPKGEIVKSFVGKLFNDSKIRDILKDNKGCIWILTDHQLLKSEKGSNQIESVFESKEIYLYALGKINDKLIVLSNNGIFEITNQQLKDFTDIPPQYQKDIFKAIYHDSHNNLYLGDNDKKTMLVLDSKNKYAVKSEIPLNDDVRDFFCYKDTTWAIGGKGLWKIYETTKLGKFNCELVLDIPFLYQIVVDDKGIFWLCSDNGLFNFDINARQLNKFTASDGLKGNIFTKICKISNGDIWLTAYKNINVFRPENIKPYENTPKIQITDIKVNDTDFTEGGNVTELKNVSLPYNRNTIALRFVAIEFADPALNRLKFRLDNYDTEGVWNDVANKDGYFKYFKLPTGTYTLHIQAANADGVWSTTEKTFIIHIKTPWYFSWGAIILWILLVLALAWLILQWRLNIQKRKAAIQQKILKTEMQALRAQMDPHFLFNAMNSINAFIVKNDIRTASSYLTDFSHLVRQILNYSKEETISLEKETEILRGYLHIEAMRFENSFDYDIAIDEDIDEWDTQIPTMILQPFIENAILHGVRFKHNGRGKISVRFEKESDDYMRCIVEDNGIGRATAAEKNKTSRPKDHDSKGMQITHDRIEILNAQKVKKASLQIIDLLDNAQQPCGTRIVLKIPIY